MQRKGPHDFFTQIIFSKHVQQKLFSKYLNIYKKNNMNFIKKYFFHGSCSIPRPHGYFFKPCFVVSIQNLFECRFQN